MKTGIYFGLSFEEYDNIPAINRSYLETLSKSVEEGWRVSPFNKERIKKEDTPALILGKAIHSAILEPHNYPKEFITAPTKEDYSDRKILDTMDDIKELLVSVGEKKSGSKKELLERCDPYIDHTKYVVWQDVLDDFKKQSEGKTVLSNDFAGIVTGIKNRLQETIEIKKLFEGGYPEVTIVWEKDGLLFKARFDYLTINNIVELKSFHWKGYKEIYKSICDEINYNHYNMQFTYYHNALKNAIQEVNKGKSEVYGDVDQKWLESFLRTPKSYNMVFVRKEEPYQTIAVKLNKGNDGATENCYYDQGLTTIEKALVKHREYTKRAEDNKNIDPKLIWRDEEIRELSDEDVPNIYYQN